MWDRSFIESQYPTLLAHVNLNTIQIGSPGIPSSSNPSTFYHIGEVVKPSMSSNQGFIIDRIDYNNKKYGVKRVYSKNNWKPVANQPIEWYGYSELESQYPSKN
jgi:hypothetical protein